MKALVIEENFQLQLRTASVKNGAGTRTIKRCRIEGALALPQLAFTRARLVPLFSIEIGGSSLNVWESNSHDPRGNFACNFSAGRDQVKPVGCRLLCLFSMR